MNTENKNAKKVKTLGGLPTLCYIGKRNRPRGVYLGAACLTVGTTLGVAPLRSTYPHPRYKDTKNN